MKKLILLFGLVLALNVAAQDVTVAKTANSFSTDLTDTIVGTTAWTFDIRLKDKVYLHYYAITVSLDSVTTDTAKIFLKGSYDGTNNWVNVDTATWDNDSYTKVLYFDNPTTPKMWNYYRLSGTTTSAKRVAVDNVSGYFFKKPE